MADGEKRIKELSTINELNSNHFFVVDDNSSGGATKKFPASNYNAVKTYAEAALYNEIDVENYLWAQAPTYTKGNVVINPDDGKIYICVVSSSTQGQFVDAEWDRMNLYGMCLDLRDDISNEPMKLSTQSTTYPINKGDIVYRYVDGDDGNSHFYAKFYRAKEDHPNGVTSFVASDWDEFASLTELLSDCNKQIYSLDEAMTQALVEGKASGEIATFTDGSNLPLKSLEVAIEPIQSGSGEPSPTNIRPISGWSAVDVMKCGKNLYGGIDFANSVKDASPNGAIDTTNKTVTYSYGTGSKITIFDTFKPLTSYTFLFKVADCSGQNFSMRIVYTDGTTEGIEILTSDIGNYVRKVSNPNKTVSKLAVMWYQLTLVKLYYDECGIFEGNIQVTDFEPYNGQVITIDLDGTRYGGKLDVVNGVLTVDRVYVDLGTLNYTYEDTSTPKVFRATLSPTPKVSGYTICSVYKGTSKGVGALEDGELCISGTTAYPFLRIRDDAYTDATAFKTSVNGQQLVYELATPIEVQLTPTIIKSLQGDNNFFASTGEILDATYVRNANITINDLIRRIEALES